MTTPTSIGRPGARARTRAAKLRSTVERLLPAAAVEEAADDAPDGPGVAAGSASSANGQHAASSASANGRAAAHGDDMAEGGAVSGARELGATFLARASETGARFREASPDQPLLVRLGLRRAPEPQLPASFVHARPQRPADTGIDPRAISIGLTILTAIALFPLLRQLAIGHADGTGAWTAFLPGYGESPDRADRWGLAVGAAGPLLLLIPLDAFYSSVVDYVSRRRGIRRRRDAGLARDRALLAEELAWATQGEVPKDASASPGMASTRRHLQTRDDGAPSTEHPATHAGAHDPGAEDDETSHREAAPDRPAEPATDSTSADAAPTSDASSADGPPPEPDASAAAGDRDVHGAAEVDTTAADPHDSRDASSAGPAEQVDPDRTLVLPEADDTPGAVRAAAIRLADELDAEAAVSEEIAAVLATAPVWYTIHDGTCGDVGFPHLVLGPSTALVLPCPAAGREDVGDTDAMVAALTETLGGSPAVIRVGDGEGAVPVAELVELVAQLPEVLDERAAASRRLVELTGATPRDPVVSGMLQRVRDAGERVPAREAAAR